MATYVNDLRLKEIGTGESSGTWGSETNTNLELIGEALGFGTEAITTNADTHTTTVADGSTDPGRAMYLKYTGTLDSACTITIAPNTISRMHFIENGTSGSQNIIISQGTGANVTIPAGDVKAVYLDGAGSGAAVTDAFASLNVVDLKVEDDLTVTDDLIVNGDIDLEGNMDVNGSLETDALSLNGTTVSSTAAELNLLDGSSANTVVNSKAVIYGSSGELAGTLSTAAQTNITSLGTLTTLTVDDITINGSTISDAGNLTLDVGGDLTLDADGGDIFFADAGTNIGQFRHASSSFIIKSTVTDNDLILRGDDGGSAVDALTLDMSNAGAATFNGAVTADAGVSIDNITIDGTEIDLSSGSLTIDVASDLILDVGNDTIELRDSGTKFGEFISSSTDFVIKSSVSDKDLIFKGNDGGSAITALTLDMSDAGTAIFNHDIQLPDGGIAKFGAGGDLQILHDGSDSFINDTGTGNLLIRAADQFLVQDTGGKTHIKSVINAQTELYHNNSKRLETTSTGIEVDALGNATTLSINSSTHNASAASEAILQFGYGHSGSPDAVGNIKLVENSTNSFDGNMIFSVPSNDSSGGSATAEAMRIRFNGDVGLGTTSPEQKLHIKDTSNPASPNGSVVIEGQRDGTANLMELRARDNSNSSSALPAGQGGIIRMNGFDGTDFEEMAFIGYQAEATVADGDAPSRLIFGTTSDGVGVTSEKMRITSGGSVLIGTTTDVAESQLIGALKLGNGVNTGIGIKRLAVASSATTVFDVSDFAPSDSSGDGLYMFSLCRTGGSFGTRFVGILGVDNAEIAVVETLESNGFTITVSGMNLQAAVSGTTQSCVATLQPLAIGE